MYATAVLASLRSAWLCSSEHSPGKRTTNTTSSCAACCLALTGYDSIGVSYAGTQLQQKLLQNLTPSACASSCAWEAHHQVSQPLTLILADIPQGSASWLTWSPDMRSDCQIPAVPASAGASERVGTNCNSCCTVRPFLVVLLGGWSAGNFGLWPAAKVWSVACCHLRPETIPASCKVSTMFRAPILAAAPSHARISSDPMPSAAQSLESAAQLEPVSRAMSTPFLNAHRLARHPSKAVSGSASSLPTPLGGASETGQASSLGAVHEDANQVRALTTITLLAIKAAYWQVHTGIY